MKKFLLIQTAFIGDVILSTALAEKLHHFFPDAQIDMLVRKGNETLLLEHPYIRQVLVWDKRTSKYKNLFGLLKRVRSQKYDHVINLQRFAASGFLTAFSKGMERIGFKKNPFSWLFDRRMEHIIGGKNNNGQHEVTRCLKLIEHLTDDSFQMPRLYPSAQDRVLSEPYCSNTFSTISPASVWFTKQTPIGVWVDLINRNEHIQFFLLGALSDVSLCEEIKSACANKNVEILAGKLSLLQSAALMERAAMNYTNDSAPLHLCSAMNAPVTAVFCSTIPEFGFGPLSEHSFIVETKEQLTCRPCGLHGHNACPKGHFKCAHIQIV